MALAEFLALSREDVRGYGMAGLLHDIGKTRIPIAVLTKPGKLTDEERALMNEHPAAPPVPLEPAAKREPGGV